ncbi:MAG: RNA 2',3'-cyclic phosphodiesterase [Acidobacteriaceae bacterium]|nr:RNA 2',3'-cyclic phosphodiesterase [Acidobacteriaceae bacterium]MBV9778886.1 RNA 2',3'-cyclic phosphodiesterase [Acidobacteriaceae bacterium]
MRLFTAIDLPSAALLRLERLLTALRPEALIKWTPLDNLHVTIKFIGQWPESRLEELYRALDLLVLRSAFRVELSRLGWFPDERSPRILWAGIDGGEPLLQLARDTEEQLEKIGISKENRQFSPHLTLARINHSVPLTRLKQRVKELQPASLGDFPVSHFDLYRSDPGSNFSIYSNIRRFNFVRAVAAP